nr:extensin-like [Nicotiana tomentosiformis]
MPKASQTPSKAKSSTKAEEKPKIMKPKLKKSAKSSREPTPTPTPAPYPSIYSTIPTSSSPIPAAPTIPTSTVPPPPKPPTNAPELTEKNTSWLTKVKATPRKSVKKMPDAATQPHLALLWSALLHLRPHNTFSTSAQFLCGPHFDGLGMHIL